MHSRKVTASSPVLVEKLYLIKREVDRSEHSNRVNRTVFVSLK